MPRKRRRDAPPPRPKRPKRAPGGAAAQTVAHFAALQPSPAAAARADALEWLGDAVIGERVGRCLLANFRRAPLSARVFRNLRLAVVTNRNLAQVYDAMGYASLEAINSRPNHVKQRADVVEAIVGELVLQLHELKLKLQPDEDGYTAHLDAVLATMLHLHFVDRTRAAERNGETGMKAKGPLSVAFNPFACLPEEQLDEVTGKLVIHDGVFEHKVFEDEKREERAANDLIEEYKQSAQTKGSKPHHYFLPVEKITDVRGSGLETRTPVKKHVHLAMLQLGEDHILRTSSEIFEVFKIYGMTVLSERMSLSLALPHLSLEPQDQIKLPEMITSARLTRQRQLVLSVANLAACAASLGIVDAISPDTDSAEREEAAIRRLEEEHGRADTLRAFVGFHSAVATTSTSANRRSDMLVNAICRALFDTAFSNQSESNHSALCSTKIPEREPLVTMLRSVGEAQVFMNSKTCDDLHAYGERPKPEEALERERHRQPSLLLRQCDSNKLENLFETLNKEQEASQNHHEAAPAAHTQRRTKPKKKKTTEGFSATAGCITRNLERFLHRRFLFCLEEIVVLFAQRKTEACRAQIAVFEHDLEPCADQPHFRKWEVSTSTLTLAMRDSFFRMLLHDICQFHAIVSSSRNTRDGTRITQLRLPLHYTWANIDTRITTEQQARS